MNYLAKKLGKPVSLKLQGHWGKPPYSRLTGRYISLLNGFLDIDGKFGVGLIL